MQILFLTLAVVLMLNLGVGMWRVLHGPTAADRMLAAQLFGATAVAILLLRAEAAGNVALHDVGLVFALLAGVAGFIWLYLVSTPEETADTLSD